MKSGLVGVRLDLASMIPRIQRFGISILWVLSSMSQGTLIGISHHSRLGV